MISAYLNISSIPGAKPDDPGKDEEWGWVSLASAPSVGDYINVFHDHEFQIVRIKGIMHRAVKLPPPEFGRQEPTLEIEAEWVTIDLDRYKSL